MLTLYYVAATWLQSWRLSATLSKIKEIRKKKGSIVLHQEVPPYVFMVRSASAESRMEVNGVLSKSCSNYNISNIKDLIWFSANKKILSIYPQQELDVSGWISVIPGKTQLPFELDGESQIKLSPDSRHLMLLEADYNTCVYSQLGPHHTLQVEKYGVPLAWHVAEHMSLLFETDERRLTALCVSFMHNNLSLENGVKIIRMISVKVRGTPYRIRNSDSVPQKYAALDPELNGNERREVFVSRWRAHVSMMATFCEAVQQVSITQQEISVRHPGSGVGAVRLVPGEDMTASEEEDETNAEEEEEVDKDEDGEGYSGAGSVTENEQCGGEYTPSDTHTATNPTTVCCRSSTVSSLREDTVSTDTVIPPDSTRNSGELSMDTPASSLRSFPSTPLRSTVSTSLPTSSTKPPNILVFSESSSTADAVKSALLATLATNKYTVDNVSWSRLIDPKMESRLLVVHGDVPTPGPLINRLVTCPGTAAFVLCSDLLRTVLPMFRTAEVRPNELVRCSYKTWKHVPLVHHIFMYQPTPPANAFSHDHQSNVLPDWVEMSDESGCKQRLKVQVLGTEETWKTPSLLQVTFTNSNSTIVFSQVHLELEPGGGEAAERLEALRQSDRARLEILCDVLSKHLGLEATLKRSPITFTPAYFLGNHERKQMLVSELSERGYLSQSSSLECGSGLTLKLCGKGVTPPPATSSLLPVLLHSCPSAFSPVHYFEELKSDLMGRLVIFSEVMSSSMDLVRGPPLHHGLAIIPLRQTHGTGRGNNSWLSPEGCGMFTLQLHVPLTSYLGSHLSLLQHIAGLAVVSAICSIPGLQELDIGLKWPNDIYANKSVKIGGIITTSTVSTNSAICNIGCGVNVFNKEPTVCINDLISAHCDATRVKVEALTLEKYFALVFNKMEELYDLAQSNHIDQIYKLYYDFWLHSDAEVCVRDANGGERSAIIRGIDEFGFLLADIQDELGERVTLQPDGNSFDMMAGLIMSKS